MTRAGQHTYDVTKTRAEMVIVHEAGIYKVQEIERLACKECATGWGEGTLKLPACGGEECFHGPGVWQVGTVGKRGGWYPIGPCYKSMAAAVVLCDALVTAANLGGA